MGVSDKQCGGLLPAAIPLILFKSNTSIIDNADTSHCNEQHGTPAAGRQPLVWKKSSVVSKDKASGGRKVP